MLLNGLLRETDQKYGQVTAANSVCPSIFIKAVYVLSYYGATSPLRLWQRHTPFSLPISHSPPSKYEFYSEKVTLTIPKVKEKQQLVALWCQSIGRAFLWRWFDKIRATVILAGTSWSIIGFCFIFCYISRSYLAWAKKRRKQLPFLIIPTPTISLLICN